MERAGNFIDFLIEAHSRHFALWLAPEQVRVDADFSATPFKAKNANAEQE